VHFFVVGALLFVAHRAWVGDERVIHVTAGVRADVARRFRDHHGRAPTPAELATALSEWKRDEALYREALRERLDREDATVRAVLADKMRARAALEVSKRLPSDVELERWLVAHRDLYESERRYEYESIAFARSEPDADRQVESFLGELASGKQAPPLGRPVVGGTVGIAELRRRLGANAAERIAALPPGRWERVATGDAWLLVRVVRVTGGLPSVRDIRPRLIADFTYAAEQQAIERSLRSIVERYRFEEQP
jgi:hypothetical protein